MKNEAQSAQDLRQDIWELKFKILEQRQQLLKKIFYLFIHERHRERGRNIGRGRSRLPAGSPMRDSIPGPRDHDLSQRQTLNRWAPQTSLGTLDFRVWKLSITGPAWRNQHSLHTCRIYTMNPRCPRKKLKFKSQGKHVGNDVFHKTSKFEIAPAMCTL